MLSFFNTLSLPVTLNILNSSLNESTVSLTGKSKTFSQKDFHKSSILYLMNLNFSSISVVKFLELKLLEFYQVSQNSSKILIQQNNVCTEKSYKKIKQNFDSYVLFNFPNKVFFEESGLFLNNSGILKKKIKVIKR